MTHVSDGFSIGGKAGTGTGPSVKARLATLNFVPPTLDRDGICAAQTRTGAGNLTLNGALVSASTGRAYIDAGTDSFGRCLTAYSSGNLSSLTFTIYGWDRAGKRVVSQSAGPNNSTVTFPKAFFVVERVKVSGTIGTAVEIGTSDRFGLPMVVRQAAEIAHVGWSTTLARDTGTLVVGATTSPATATSLDPRGTYVPSSASDGTKRLCIVIVPLMTSKATQYGVKQYGEGIP